MTKPPLKEHISGAGRCQMKLEMTAVEKGTMVKKADHCNGGTINQHGTLENRLS